LRKFLKQFKKYDGAPPHYVQNTAQEIRENRDILNREACIAKDGKHFEQLL
jgi:hypothetical protein